VLARFPAPAQPGPGANPASYTGEKRPVRGCDHQPTSSAEFKESVELYLYSSFGPSWPVLGWTLLYLLYFSTCHTSTVVWEVVAQISVKHPFLFYILCLIDTGAYGGRERCAQGAGGET
jgi:hypothetical protein